jgi:hypothetical protein
MDFCRIMTCEAIMVDYESNVKEAQFDSLTSHLEYVLTKKIKKKNKSPWPRFYLGALLVTKGAHQIRFARYFDFTKNMLNGYIQYQIDSTLVDAAISIYMIMQNRVSLVGFQG